MLLGQAHAPRPGGTVVQLDAVAEPTEDLAADGTGDEGEVGPLDAERRVEQPVDEVDASTRSPSVATAPLTRTRPAAISSSTAALGATERISKGG